MAGFWVFVDRADRFTDGLDAACESRESRVTAKSLA